MGHHHSHGHAHRHGVRTDHRGRLLVCLFLAAGYMVAEVIGGLWTGSLALLADAGHMLSDVAAIGLSLFAVWLTRRPPNPKRSYGYYRAEILAALVNGATLIAIAIGILLEAWRRLQDPPAVMGSAMLAIAFGGLIVNLIGLRVLHEEEGESLNIRGARLHILTDALGSIGAMLAAGMIWAFGWKWIDPAVSALIGVLVIYSSWRLVAESVSVLLESVPHGIDVDEVRRTMATVNGVLDVHDLHVWSITSGMDCLSAHVVASDSASSAELLRTLRHELHDRFGIHHVTIQIEPPDFEAHSCGSGHA